MKSSRAVSTDSSNSNYLPHLLGVVPKSYNDGDNGALFSGRVLVRWHLRTNAARGVRGEEDKLAHYPPFLGRPCAAIEALPELADGSRRRWPVRLVIDTLFYLVRNPRLSKDHERRLQSAEALIKFAMVRLMLRRLVRYG